MHAKPESIAKTKTYVLLERSVVVMVRVHSTVHDPPLLLEPFARVQHDDAPIPPDSMKTEKCIRAG